MRTSIALSAVIVGTAVLLGAVAFTSVADHDWHAAVTINGASIGRADARNRLSVLTALAAARTDIATRLALGTASAAEGDALLAAAGPGDLVTATVDDLVRERAVRDEAAIAGITAGQVDPWAELAAAAYEPAAIHIRFVLLAGPSDVAPAAVPPDGWPEAPQVGPLAQTTLAARDQAAEQALAMISGSSSAAVVEAANGAGWVARGQDTWIATRGPVAGIPATLLAAARRVAADPASVGPTAIGPIADEATAGVVVGVVLERGPEPDVEAVRRSVESLKVDEAWLRPWAESRALSRALEDARLTAWSTTPSRIARVREIVVSPAGLTGDAGPYAGLAHLVMEQLPSTALPASDPHPIRTGGTPAHVLAGQLRAMPLPERLVRWDELVALANSGAPADLRQSGEMGWHASAGLMPELGTAATGAGAHAGQIIGPITTTVGQELFLARGVFPGTLDERAGALLTEITTATDLASVAKRVAPDAGYLRYDPGVTRSELETTGNEPAMEALFTDAAGVAGRPYVLDGEILVAVPISREEAVPTGQVLDRIGCAAFEAWIGERMATYTVAVDDDPFGASQPRASPTPMAPAIPTVEPMPTPPVITIPGQGTEPTPVGEPFARPTVP